MLRSVFIPLFVYHGRQFENKLEFCRQIFTFFIMTRKFNLNIENMFPNHQYYLYIRSSVTI